MRLIMIFQVRFQVLLILLLQLIASSAAALPDYRSGSLADEISINNITQNNTAIGRKELQQLFLRLFPDYRLARDNQCLQSSEENQTTDLVFFSNSQRPELQIVELQIVALQNPNAFSIKSDTASSATIAISTGILELAASDEERGFILAHEMAHLRQNYFLPDLSNTILTTAQLKFFQEIYQKWEHNADAEAANTLVNAGISATKGSAIIKKAAAHGQSNFISFFHHPAAELRQAELERE